MNFFRQMSGKMCKTFHRMQSENKTDTKVVSPRPETEKFGLGTCLLGTYGPFSNRPLYGGARLREAHFQQKSTGQSVARFLVR